MYYSIRNHVENALFCHVRETEKKNPGANGLHSGPIFHPSLVETRLVILGSC